MSRKVLLFPCGLIAGASYLSATLETSFSHERPLHTIAIALLASAFVLITHAVVTRPRRDTTDFDTAIPLNGSRHGPHGSRDSSPVCQEWTGTINAGTLGWKALVGLPILLVVAICARAFIHQRIAKDIQCAGPTTLAILLPILAAFHTLRHGKLREKEPRKPANGVVQATLVNGTRYVIPSLMLAASSFMVTLDTNALRSTYICPLAHTTSSLVHVLQILSCVLNAIIVLVIYRLLDDGIDQNGDIIVERKNRADVTIRIGIAFIASTAVLLMAGLIAGTLYPEHRRWLLIPSPEYVHDVGILSLMMPFTMLCFLCTVPLQGLMSTILVSAFSITSAQFIQALRTQLSYHFSANSAISLIISFFLLMTALAIYLSKSATIEGISRPRFHIRLGKFQSILTAIIIFSFLVTGSRYRSNLLPENLHQHPITTLIAIADETHGKWVSQARQSNTLHEATMNYRKRYSRDPPPNFNLWYEFAVSRNSIAIDDFDNIEEDLAPFSSLSPVELRRRTAEILADNQGLGGIKIRGGKAVVFSNVPGTHRWMLDGAIRMIEKFAEHLPDMDLAMNLNDECRVAVPYAKLKEALASRKRFSKAVGGHVGFSSNRSSTWLDISSIHSSMPSHFRDASFTPTFHTFGSISCPPSSLARRRYISPETLCASCLAPHSHGLFVSNWSLSSSPCHQPDLAHLHGLHISPSTFSGSHRLVPIFSQSKAPGYADIRFPSPWNYIDKVKYESDDTFPDPPFTDKENTLFWRGASSEGVSPGSGAWKGMLRQRLVHLLNNSTTAQPILRPSSKLNPALKYSLETPAAIVKDLTASVDVRFTDPIIRCGGADCKDQEEEFRLGSSVVFKQHWRYKYLFDADGAGFSGRFIPFLQSNSVVFKAALFREWYEGRLTAWKHFVPVDLRLHDLLSSVAYFGGYGGGEGRMEEAERIATQGRDWTNKVLRKEDMEIYMFRLLLEWGRLTDDKRQTIGYGIKDAEA